MALGEMGQNLSVIFDISAAHIVTFKFTITKHKNSTVVLFFPFPFVGLGPQTPSSYAYVLGFWGKAPAAKRFPGHYRGLRER